MKNKAIYILANLSIFLIIYLIALFYIQDIHFPSYWIPFTIGGLIIILAIIYAVRTRKKNPTPLVTIVLNSISVAFLANAYLVKIGLTISTTYLFIIFFSCIAFYILYIISLYNHRLLNKAELFLFILSIILIVTVIVLWIIGDEVLFSNLMFSLVITIAMTVCAISEEEYKKDIDNNMIVLSFSSLIVFIVVLSLLLESGDFLEGLGSGTFDGNVNRKPPQNIKF